jgi:hypothetical protein
MGHNIIPNDAGWGLFGVLIAAFLVVTLIFALSLKVILPRLRRVRMLFAKLFTELVEFVKYSQVLETLLSLLDALRHVLGSRRREEESMRAQDIETGIEDID